MKKITRTVKKITFNWVTEAGSEPKEVIYETRFKDQEKFVSSMIRRFGAGYATDIKTIEEAREMSMDEFLDCSRVCDD